MRKTCMIRSCFFFGIFHTVPEFWWGYPMDYYGFHSCFLFFIIFVLLSYHIRLKNWMEKWSMNYFLSNYFGCIMRSCAAMHPVICQINKLYKILSKAFLLPFGKKTVWRSTRITFCLMLIALSITAAWITIKLNYRKKVFWPRL